MNTVVIRQAVESLHQKYGSEVTEVAAMVFTARRLMLHAARSQGITANGLIKTLDRVVESHLIDRELHPLLLQQALHDLEMDVPLTPSAH